MNYCLPTSSFGSARNRWIAPRLEIPGGTPPHRAEETRSTLNTPRKKCIRAGLPLASKQIIPSRFRSSDHLINRLARGRMGSRKTGTKGLRDRGTKKKETARLRVYGKKQTCCVRGWGAYILQTSRWRVAGHHGG